MENQNPSTPYKNNRLDLLTEAKLAPESPGIYMMKSRTSSEALEILYIGKAKNLSHRLVSYFQPEQHPIPRVQILINRVEEFEVVLTESESEALILECTLIKKHKPRFNVRLKDDKAYPYLKIKVEDKYPKIDWTRRVIQDGSRYFGPFPSAWSARQIMNMLNHEFLLRDCSDNTFQYRSRPCLLYQMKKCLAPCVGYIDSFEYHKSIQKIINILEGQPHGLVQNLRQRMMLASENEEYEKATEIRDQIKNLELITTTQSAETPNQQRARDVFGIFRHLDQAHGTIVKVRGGKISGIQHFLLQNSDASYSDSELLTNFIKQYYVEISKSKGGEKWEDCSVRSEMPQEILLPFLPEHFQELQEFGHSLKLGFDYLQAEEPADHQLLNVAKLNAQYALEQWLKKNSLHQSVGIAALDEIRKKLHLSKTPFHMECYDISNLHGQDAVASRVVFVNGLPEKTLYRRYKIKSVHQANDFAMMKEVLERRFLNQAESHPDLVIVDGGKGQLSQAIAILEELNIQGVCIAALAKAKVTNDFQASEIKTTSERIFIPNRKNPIILFSHTKSFKLLTHLRDESHRFALQYHRLLRNKRTVKESANR